MARKGYKDIKKQIEANERYLEKNEEAKLKKKIISLRGNGKNYIKNYADLLGLQEFETLIKERKKELELQE
ncbi:hypothetical protein [Fusobacterium hwasookii]|jgi:hypothetical protein|uniref:Phage protein n=1 Tax=Fusobacterium hwasookii ChDC F128 TaxID=1216362 RepID=A0ABP2R1Z1_9FUSO|nr:hypothetical protein [Fusobacterium hwasookii]EJU06707.1 hypothetical protein B437_11067 [Fusobacterium hwasookii ChDC F128]